MSSLRCLSLFSGYSGLDMGVQAAIGGQVVAVSDVDPGPCRILTHRYPSVPNLGDITQINWADVRDSLGPIDVICGGSPCPDLSIAGKRAGMREGTRSGLWSSMLEAIRVLRPCFIVWENVKGALSATADSSMARRAGRLGNVSGRPALRALGRVLGDLASIGYDAQWGCLRASDIGAPHRRERVFVIAWPATDTECLRRWGNATTSEKAGRRASTVASGRGNPHLDLLPTPDASIVNDGEGPDTWLARRREVKAKTGNGNGMGMPLTIAVQLLPTPRAADGDATMGAPGAARHVAAGNGSLGEVLGVELLDTLSGTDALGGHTRRGGSRGDELPLPGQVVECATDWGKYQSAIDRWTPIIGRAAPAPIQPSKNGKPQLAPVFVEWMMGLPAGHVTDPDMWDGVTPSAAREAQLKALGNGVVPLQAATAIRALINTAVTQLNQQERMVS